ncbi:MAG: hypothetical protein ABSH20_29870 [Tepidisphaeraceae bacterium]|jgi:hypothetical protein
MTLIPDYQGPDTAPPAPPSVLRYIAILCGAAPLIAGFSTLGLWLVTRDPSYQFIGLRIILVGLFMFALGSICLFSFWIASRRRQAAGLSVPRLLWIWCLLFLNFPACLACMWVAEYVQTHSKLVVPTTRLGAERH